MSVMNHDGRFLSSTESIIPAITVGDDDDDASSSLDTIPTEMGTKRALDQPGKRARQPFIRSGLA